MTGNDDDERMHRRFGGSGDVYCRRHGASFEAREAVNNDGECPWCGDDVTEVVGS